MSGSQYIMPCGHYLSQCFRVYKHVDGVEVPDGVSCSACITGCETVRRYSQAEIDAVESAVSDNPLYGAKE